MMNIDLNKVSVPSLYVRVYQRELRVVGCILCSLIICEGVSLAKELGMTVIVFPHRV